MRKITRFMRFIFVLLALSVTQLAVAEWRSNTIKNETTEDVFVVYSTWQEASGVFPRGYRTIGHFRIAATREQVFHAWGTNHIYFHISKGSDAIKPTRSRETFRFWLHPVNAFHVVSQQMGDSVTTAQLSYSSSARTALAHADGFMKYGNGSRVSITSGWVNVTGEVDARGDAAMDVDGNGVVDAEDVALVAARFGQTGENVADVNRDGAINTADIMLVANALGTVIEAPVTVIEIPVTAGTGGITDAPIPPPPEGMVLIPAGEFEMGSVGVEAYDDEQPIHTVSVDAFYMDTHEVTNRDYQRFVLANPEWQKGQLSRRYHDGDYLNVWDGNNYGAAIAEHPVVYVSWYAAMAYAKWVGKRLPTEAEWEKAARGGLSGKKYPWGNAAPNGTQCNFADRNTDFNWADENADDGYTYPAPVGSYPANGYGLYDMAGNVWEWCLDEYNADFYETSPRENPFSGGSIIEVINNVTNVTTQRVARGGSWTSSTGDLRVTLRVDDSPRATDIESGFRCVKGVSP